MNDSPSLYSSSPQQIPLTHSSGDAFNVDDVPDSDGEIVPHMHSSTVWKGHKGRTTAPVPSRLLRNSTPMPAPLIYHRIATHLVKTNQSPISTGLREQALGKSIIANKSADGYHRLLALDQR